MKGAQLPLATQNTKIMILNFILLIIFSLFLGLKVEIIKATKKMSNKICSVFGGTIMWGT